MRVINFLLHILLMHLVHLAVLAQRTSLDEAFGKLYRPFRLLGETFFGRTGDDEKNLELVQMLGKSQIFNINTQKFVCDSKNGPGRRSNTPPLSVHRLRPGDIDIIGALGDSLTAGNGIFATKYLHVLTENRGASWSIGGKDIWSKYLTLPNILKEFNPNLYGYSLKDGISTDRSSKFNVAELGAMSRDVPHEAKVLLKRMQRDPRVNMTQHWKLVTIFIGHNDFCSDICYYPNPEKTIEGHERNMVKTYRYLRDNIPRLMVNVVPALNLRLLTRFVGLPVQCIRTLPFNCPCLLGKGKSKSHLDYYENIMKHWIAKDIEIANRAEFNSNTFTLNIQPFSQFKDIPRLPNGSTDLSILSEDCFHMSQKGHAFFANALWNNLLEADDEKTQNSTSAKIDNFRCPSEKRPFIMTRVNSRSDFRVETVL